MTYAMLETSSSTGSILVPVANPETVTQLVSTATDLAEDQHLDLELLTVIRVPEQLPLSAGEQFMNGQRDLLNDAIELVTNPNIEVSGRVRFARSVAGGILSAIEDHDIQIALLGWRGRPRRRDIVLGSHLDYVLKHATCDILVERMDKTPNIETILLPVAGGPNTKLAATTAGSLARAHDADLHVITIRSPTNSSREHTQAESMLQQVISNFTQVPTITQEVIEDESVTEAIVDQSEDFDLMILGAASNTLLRRSLIGSMPEQIGRESSCPIIIAKRYQNIRSLTARTVSRTRARLSDIHW
jgi:nucleotide-binding universal stress UspA family protein